MVFSCNKILLANAVANVSKAASSKSTLPTLEGIYIKLENNNLLLTGYDLELGIQTTIEVNGDTDGEIVLNARLINDILRKMPNEDITINVDDKFLTLIKSTQVEYTIVGMNPEEYPTLPEIKENDKLNISQPLLKSMIEQTIFAVSTDEHRAVLTGSLFVIEDNVFKIISLDGYRLAIRTEKIEQSEDMRFIVPSKALYEVAKLLSDDDEDKLIINVGRKHIVFEISGYQIISRLIEGEFLDYNDSIRKESSTEVKISAGSFIESLDRASLLINENTRSPVRCIFEDDKVKLSCVTALGKINDKIDCNISGDTVEIGFNNRYLLDALRASGSDEVLLKMSGGLSPMKIVPLDGDSFLFLVLPMRLRNE